MGWQGYLLSALTGVLVGALYGLVQVRSPAPPIVALLGLLGILVGESGVQWLRGHPNAVASALHAKAFTGSARSMRGAPHPGDPP